MFVKRFLGALAILSLTLCVALAQDRGSPKPADVQAVLDKAIGYLKTTQTAEGAFAPKIAGPGVTALVVAGLVKNGVSPTDPMVEKAVKYLQGQVQKDGGVYNKFLANYTTSVAVMAFKELNTDGKYDTLLKNAGDFLKGIQNGDKESYAFGGFGYDKKSRPDLSNSNFTLEALLAAGLTKDDPAVQNALKFISRCQNLPGEHNDQKFALKATKEDIGGFTYNPGEEKGSHTTPEGGLRSLGGMTYGGLKSFLYAGVSKEDPRVKAALTWIRKHYTLEENPGMGQAGLYYYYHTFGKAMNALGDNTFESDKGKHVWRTELFEALKKRQQPNGSWQNTGDKTFGESNADLATSFAILSLGYVK